MLDETMWAILNEDTGKLVGNKFSRTLWRNKPTNAINVLLFKAGYSGINLNLKAIQVRITEIEYD